MTSSVVRHLPRQLNPAADSEEKRERERKREAEELRREAEKEMMKGICVEHFEFVWTRRTTEVAVKQMDGAFMGIWCSDSSAAGEDLQLGDIKVPCPVEMTLAYTRKKRKI